MAVWTAAWVTVRTEVTTQAITPAPTTAPTTSPTEAPTGRSACSEALASAGRAVTVSPAVGTLEVSGPQHQKTRAQRVMRLETLLAGAAPRAGRRPGQVPVRGRVWRVA